MCARANEMAFLPETGSLDPITIRHTYKKLALEAFNEAKAEVMSEVRTEAGASDIRMAALHLAQHMVPADGMIDFADSLAQYVLTGKKQGAEG